MYLFIPEVKWIDFFDVYGKDEKDDLTPKEKKVLVEFANTVRQEAMEAFRRSGGKP